VTKSTNYLGSTKPKLTKIDKSKRRETDGRKAMGLKDAWLQRF